MARRSDERAAPRSGRLAAALAIVPVAWLAAHGAPAVRWTTPAADARGRGCMLWFVGSSSIARWATLDADMAPWISDNRGIPGATLGEIALRFPDRQRGIVPRAVVLYGGDNDLARGEPPAAVLRDFAALIDRKSAAIGDVPLLVISVKPSPARWTELARQRAVNEAIRRLAARRDDVDMVDVAPRMLIDGRPGDFFADDGVHLNAAGYRVWTAAVRSALDRTLPRSTVAHCTDRAGA